MPYSNLSINPNAGSASPLGFNPLSSLAGQGGNFNLPSSFDANNSFLQATMPQASSSGNGSMLRNMLSGGLGALGSVFSSLLSAGFARRAAKRQFEYNKALMDKQNQMQRDMLVDEMALKMQGYKNAGLSTASLAGNFSNNTAVPSQSVGAPQGTAHDMRLGDIFNAARQVKLQEDAIQSEIDLNNANARKINAEAAPIEEYGMQTASANLQNLDQNTRTLLSQEEKNWTDAWNSIQLTDAQIRQINGQLDIAYKTLPIQLQVLASEVYKNEASGALSHAQAAEAYQAIRESAKRIEKMTVDMGLTSAQTAVAWALAALHQQERKTEGYRTVTAHKEAQQAQLDYDVANSMGIRYYQLRNVIQTISPLGWLFGFANAFGGRGAKSTVDAFGTRAGAARSSGSGLVNQYRGLPPSSTMY